MRGRKLQSGPAREKRKWRRSSHGSRTVQEPKCVVIPMMPKPFTKRFGCSDLLAAQEKRQSPLHGTAIGQGPRLSSTSVWQDEKGRWKVLGAPTTLLSQEKTVQARQWIPIHLAFFRRSPTWLSCHPCPDPVKGAKILIACRKSRHSRALAERSRCRTVLRGNVGQTPHLVGAGHCWWNAVAPQDLFKS
jgi:hypothetical protein